MHLLVPLFCPINDSWLPPCLLHSPLSTRGNAIDDVCITACCCVLNCSWVPQGIYRFQRDVLCRNFCWMNISSRLHDTVLLLDVCDWFLFFFFLSCDCKFSKKLFDHQKLVVGFSPTLSCKQWCALSVFCWSRCRLAKKSKVPNRTLVPPTLPPEGPVN